MVLIFFQSSRRIGLRARDILVLDVRLNNNARELAGISFNKITNKILKRNIFR